MLCACMCAGSLSVSTHTRHTDVRLPNPKPLRPLLNQKPPQTHKEILF